MAHVYKAATAATPFMRDLATNKESVASLFYFNTGAWRSGEMREEAQDDGAVKDFVKGGRLSVATTPYGSSCSVRLMAALSCFLSELSSTVF